MLDLNITLLIQLANFFIALILLNTLLISPIRGIIRSRRAELEKRSNEASRFAKQAADRLTNYEEELSKARQEAAKVRATFRTKASESATSCLTDAQNKAQALLSENRAKVEKESQAALKELRGQTATMADMAIKRILQV